MEITTEKGSTGMTKYEMTKIAKKHGLTFKEMVRLIIIKSEIKQNQKFENGDGVNLKYGFNGDIKGRELSCYESLASKGFLRPSLGGLLEKGLNFPYDMGAVSYIGGCDDQDVLSNVRALI